MYCPSCSKENPSNDFCENCGTNLVIIHQFMLRADSKAKRSKLISKSGLVSIIISEGFAWTLFALVIFLVIITIASVFLSRNADTASQPIMAFAILLALLAFCGIPLLLGLVLLLKDITQVTPKQASNEKQEKES